MTIAHIALYTGLAGLVWTIIEIFLKKSDSFIISFLKNWVAAFFIFSAVIKLVDPVGFSIKLGDYFDVFHLEFFKPFKQLLAFIILVLEFILGVALLFNAKKKLTYSLLIGMIVFFTLLTGVSAIFNVVQDCGCFGDLLKVSPWTSFFKDIILLVMILLFSTNSKHLKPWFNSAGQWMVYGFSTVVALAFTLHNFYHLPMWDFRAYKVGTYIPEKMNVIKAPVYENRFTYENTQTGEQEVFVNTFPKDSIWKFVSNDQKLIDEGIPAPIHDFSLINSDGDDLTDQILSFEKPILLIIAHDVSKAKTKGGKKINELLNASDASGAFNYAFVSASSDEAVETWKQTNGFKGTNLSGDGTMLKTVVRSNPGLVLLQNGTILGKWHYRDTPSETEITSLIN